jgi:hypothetical protein
VGGRTHARVLNNKWAKVVANGERLPIKVEPGCALLLRTTNEKLVDKARDLYARVGLYTLNPIGPYLLESACIQPRA